MLQKNNAFIPGVRPGAKTKEFLDFILNRLTFFGALFLVVICIFPVYDNRSSYQLWWYSYAYPS